VKTGPALIKRPGRVRQQVVYDGVGELGAGRSAPHVDGSDAPADRVVQCRVDAQSGGGHAHVAEHPGGRPDHARRVGHRMRVAGVHGRPVVVPPVLMVAVAGVRVTGGHRAEHGHPLPVRGERHRGLAAGQRAARRAGERPVQAGRQQHAIPAGVLHHS